MTTTTSASTTAAASVARQLVPTAGLRLAAWAGMAFAVSVIAQNLWAQGTAVLPDADATPAEVVDAFVDAGNATAVLVSWVAANLILIVTFLAGAHHRLRRDEPVWAGLGLVGGAALVAFFVMLQVPIVALAVGGQSLADSPELVSVLWTSHRAIFAFAGLALGLALVGFSLAAASAGLVPGWFRIVGPVGAAIMIGASIPVQAGAEGEPATMVGLVGFVVWLAFLLIFGNRLRQEA